MGEFIQLETRLRIYYVEECIFTAQKLMRSSRNEKEKKEKKKKKKKEQIEKSYQISTKLYRPSIFIDRHDQKAEPICKYNARGTQQATEGTRARHVHTYRSITSRFISVLTRSLRGPPCKTGPDAHCSHPLLPAVPNGEMIQAE